MALTAEQIAEARSEGYSDAEILDHYAKTTGADIAAARKEGYTNAEILGHLSGSEVSPQEKAASTEKSALTDPALSGALGAGAGAVYSAKTIPVKAAKALGSAVANRIPSAAPAPTPASAAPTYTTPSGIPVQQTPGGLHPGAVGNAQFNVEQQQANALRQNMAPGYEQRGTSRIMTPIDMQEPAAALGGSKGAPTVGGMRAELAQAAKKTVPAVGGAIRGVATSNPAAGAMAGYNLQDALNRYREGDITGATIGGAGTAASLLPKMKGKAGLIKPIVGAGAAVVNKLRGEPESVMNKAEGGPVPPHIEHMRKGGSVQHFNGGKRALAEGVIGGAKKGYDAVKGYLEHTKQKPNPLVGTRYETKDVSNLVPIKPGRVEDIKGAVVQSNPWDDTSRGVQILSVSGKPLTKPVTTHGGQQYVRDVEHVKQGRGGASGKIIATRVQNRANEGALEGLDMGGTGEVILMPSTMGEFSANFAKPTWEIYHDLFTQAEPNKGTIKSLSDRLRNTKVRGRMPFEFAPDLMTEESARIFENNPDFRKAFVQMMQLKGNQKLIGANAEDIAAAMADPEIHGVPRGFAGHTGIEMSPGAELRPSTNESYDTDWLGKYRISLPHTPMQVLLKRRYDEILPEMQAKYPKSTPAQLDAMTLGALETRAKGVSELMDEEAINRIGQYHEGLSQGAFAPYDVGAAMEYLNKPGRYAEGGRTKMDKLKGGLSMLPMAARTELRKRGQLADTQGIPTAMAMPDQAMVNAYNSLPVQLGMQGAALVNPAVAIGVLGRDFINAAQSGDYGDAAIMGGLAGSSHLGRGIRAAKNLATMMGANPRTPAMMDRFYQTGAPDDQLHAVPAMAGGGSTIKKMMNEVMQAYGPKAAKEITPGAPHTYPPKATGPWMQDYVPEQSPIPKITYMGKYTKEPYYSSPEAKQAIMSAAERQRMQYLQRIADPNSPGNTLQDLMQQYPYYESWMK